VQTILLQYHANDFDENQTFVRNGYKHPIRSEKSYNSLRIHINQRDDYYPLKHLFGISKAISRNLMGARARSVPEAAAVFLDVMSRLNIDKSRVRIVAFKMGESSRINNGFVDAVDSIAGTPAFSDWKISTLRMTYLLTGEDYFVLDDHINAHGHKKIASRMAQTLNPGFN
jgi:hypothetical protein